MSDNCENSLEPVALYREEDLGGGHVLLKSKADAGHPDYDRYEWEPLFTAEQFIDLMEEHRERACYCDGGDGVNSPECHFCAFVRNVREEFTQNGDSIDR